MNSSRIAHVAAMLSLLVVAAQSFLGSMRYAPGAPAEMKFAPVFSFAIWSWLLWKVWKRPQAWSLGVGILLFLMIAFQSYLWWTGINHPELAGRDFDRSKGNFILYELPIFIAGVCCIWLWLSHPRETPGQPVQPS